MASSVIRVFFIFQCKVIEKTDNPDLLIAHNSDLSANCFIRF